MTFFASSRDVLMLLVPEWVKTTTRAVRPSCWYSISIITQSIEVTIGHIPIHFLVLNHNTDTVSSCCGVGGSHVFGCLKTPYHNHPPSESYEPSYVAWLASARTRSVRTQFAVFVSRKPVPERPISDNDKANVAERRVEPAAGVCHMNYSSGPV